MTIKATVKSAIEDIEASKTDPNYTMMYDPGYVYFFVEGLTLKQVKNAMYALRRDGFLDSSGMPGVYFLKEKTATVTAKIGTHGTGKYEVKPPENIVVDGSVMFRMVGHLNWKSGVVNRIDDDGICFIEYA